MGISFDDRVIAWRASTRILQSIVNYGTDDLLFSQESKAIAGPVVGLDVGSFDTQEVANQRVLLLVNVLNRGKLVENVERSKQQHKANHQAIRATLHRAS